MKDKAISTIKKYSMLPEGSRVLVAVSGGADSMALLHLLCELRESLGIKTIEAAHFNHMIRGAEADRDEEFVKRVCESLGIRLHVGRADVPAAAAQTGEGHEECGRRLRYEFFEGCVPAEFKIATAHNLNDNAETVLIYLIRGTGLKGMCGIPPVRGRIIRPLLACSRAEIEEYCIKNNISYVTDSTNLEEVYARNKIRKHIIPAMLEINGAALRNIYFASQHNRMDEELLESECRAAWGRIKEKAHDGFKGGVLISELISLPDGLLVRLFRLAAGEYGLELSRTGAKLLLDMVRRGTGRADLGGGYTASVRKGRLYIESYDEKAVEFADIDLSSGVFFAKGIKISIIDAKEFEKLKNVNKKLLNCSLDYDKINPNLHLRQRRDGDRITLLRRNVTKSLKKLFNEAGIPPRLRSSVPIIADGSEKVLWVAGFGADKSAAVDGGTKKVLLIEPYADKDE